MGRFLSFLTVVLILLFAVLYAIMGPDVWTVLRLGRSEARDALVHLINEYDLERQKALDAIASGERALKNLQQQEYEALLQKTAAVEQTNALEASLATMEQDMLVLADIIDAGEAIVRRGQTITLEELVVLAEHYAAKFRSLQNQLVSLRNTVGLLQRAEETARTKQWAGWLKVDELRNAQIPELDAMILYLETLRGQTGGILDPAAPDPLATAEEKLAQIRQKVQTAIQVNEETAALAQEPLPSLLATLDGRSIAEELRQLVDSNGR